MIRTLGCLPALIRPPFRCSTVPLQARTRNGTTTATLRVIYPATNLGPGRATQHQSLSKRSGANCQGCRTFLSPFIGSGQRLHRTWVTDLVPTTDNIVQLVRAARARWKIENEGFNTLKNQGYHLKHNFGHGDRHLSEALFVVNLLAFFMHQIFELVDGLYQRVRTFFSSRRAFWDEVRSAFRLFLFTSWDQVLVRMNSPPEQLPPYRSR